MKVFLENFFINKIVKYKIPSTFESHGTSRSRAPHLRCARACARQRLYALIVRLRSTDSCSEIYLLSRLLSDYLVV